MPSDPYGSSPQCILPLPGTLALHAAEEPSFTSKRNERERERVKSLKDGYKALREHLPSAVTKKRLTKVTILREAITYIQQLERDLAESPQTARHRRKNDDDDDIDDDDEGEGQCPTRAAEASRFQSDHCVEDLNPSAYTLLCKVRDDPDCKQAWTSNGKVVIKTASGKIKNINSLFDLHGCSQ